MKVQLKKTIAKPVSRPVRVPIPYSLFDSGKEEHSICLFCKSNDFQEIETIVNQSVIDGLKKVISLDQVKKNYKAVHDKRTLLREYTHFLCDSSVAHHLNNLLGTVFSARNNNPIPIDMSNISKLESIVNKGVHQSTYMHLRGQNITIRLGHTGMTEKEVVANIVSGVHEALAKIFPGKKPSQELEGVQSLHLKTSDSAALPLYSATTSEVTAFASSKLTAGKSSESSVQSASKSVVSVNGAKKGSAEKAGAKRDKKTISASTIGTVTGTTASATSAPSAPVSTSIASEAKTRSSAKSGADVVKDTNKNKKDKRKAADVESEAGGAKAGPAIASVDDVAAQERPKKAKAAVAVSAPVAVVAPSPEPVVYGKGKERGKVAVGGGAEKGKEVKGSEPEEGGVKEKEKEKAASKGKKGKK